MGTAGYISSTVGPFGLYNPESHALPLADPLPFKWDFPKIRVPYFGVLIIRILLFRVLYWGPLFSETPKCALADLADVGVAWEEVGVEP